MLLILVYSRPRIRLGKIFKESWTTFWVLLERREIIYKQSCNLNGKGWWKNCVMVCQKDFGYEVWFILAVGEEESEKKRGRGESMIWTSWESNEGGKEWYWKSGGCCIEGTTIGERKRCGNSYRSSLEDGYIYSVYGIYLGNDSHRRYRNIRRFTRLLRLRLYGGEGRRVTKVIRDDKGEF